MNSEAAGTEWIRKADAQELVDIWRKYAGLRPRTGRTAMVGQCADELAEVIARNVQPSPDAGQSPTSEPKPRRMMRLPKNPAYPNFNELHFEDDWCVKSRCTYVGDFPPETRPSPEARPVPQPATPNEELDKLRAKAARKSGDVIWLEGVLRKYGRHLSTCVKDKTYDVPCSCAWDNLALSINLPSPVIGVPQPAMEPLILANLTKHEFERLSHGRIPYSGAACDPHYDKAPRPWGKHAPYIATYLGELIPAVKAMKWTHFSVKHEHGQWLALRDTQPATEPDEQTK